MFGHISDESWFWLLTRGYRRSQLLQQVLPGVPAPDIQTRFTGVAGDNTFREGWSFYRLVKNIVRQHGLALQSNQTVVDFGCGWGRIIRFFLKDVAPGNIWGLDCLPEVISICQETNPLCQFKLVEPLPPTSIAAASVDLIYCYSVFSHLAEDAHRQWLAEFQRMLKPGGLLIATTRPREFIPQCAEVRQKQITLGQMGAASAFEDTASALAAYDQGLFCYSPTGGGDILDSSFYGETCIPKSYVLKYWTHGLEFMDFITNRDLCHQNVIVMRKPK
jgi:SAM-dependent methyltransferase